MQVGIAYGGIGKDPNFDEMYLRRLKEDLGIGGIRVEVRVDNQANAAQMFEACRNLRLWCIPLFQIPSYARPPTSAQVKAHASWISDQIEDIECPGVEILNEPWVMKKEPSHGGLIGPKTYAGIAKDVRDNLDSRVPIIVACDFNAWDSRVGQMMSYWGGVQKQLLNKDLLYEGAIHTYRQETDPAAPPKWATPPHQQWDSIYGWYRKIAGTQALHITEVGRNGGQDPAEWLTKDMELAAEHGVHTYCVYSHGQDWGYDGGFGVRTPDGKVSPIGKALLRWASR